MALKVKRVKKINLCRPYITKKTVPSLKVGKKVNINIRSTYPK